MPKGKFYHFSVEKVLKMHTPVTENVLDKNGNNVMIFSTNQKTGVKTEKINVLEADNMVLKDKNTELQSEIDTLKSQMALVYEKLGL